MAGYSDDDVPRLLDRSLDWLLLASTPSLLLLPGLPILLGAGASALTPFGRDVELDFFSALSQIAPVITLVAAVEELTRVRSILEKDIDYSDPDNVASARVFTRISLVRHFGTLVVAETACLYALATGSSTTFLVVAAVTAILLQLVAIGGMHTSAYR